MKSDRDIKLLRCILVTEDRLPQPAWWVFRSCSPGRHERWERIDVGAVFGSDVSMTSRMNERDILCCFTV